MHTLFKTDACHRFFRVFVMCIILLSNPVRSQLVLPDLPPPEESDRDVPSDQTDEDNEQVQQLIQQMKSRTSNRQESVVGKNNIENKFINKQPLYLNRDAIFRVLVTLKTGEKFSGELQNQSFRVKNPIGEFPVVLEEVSEATLLRDAENHFGFLFHDGDQISGVPSIESIRVLMMDGGERIILMKDVIALTFQVN